MKFNKKTSLLAAAFVVGIAASVTAAAIPGDYGLVYTYYSDASHSNQVGIRDSCTGEIYGTITPYSTRTLVRCSPPAQ